MASYRLKRVDFLGREVSIILQNENGPCPLLALSNVLLLRNLIRLHPDMSSVKHETLLGLVGDYVLEVNKIDHINDASIRENHYANMAEVMHSVLPKLIGGLDVNVRFTGPCDFENTSEMAIFELLDVNLYHGWLVDPQDVVLHSMVEPLSYNQLVEKIISADTQGLSPRSLKKTVSLKETLSSQSQRTTSSSALAPDVAPLVLSSEPPPPPPTVTPMDDVTSCANVITSPGDVTSPQQPSDVITTPPPSDVTITSPPTETVMTSSEAQPTSSNAFDPLPLPDPSPAIPIDRSSESQTFGRKESMSGVFMLQHWLEVSQSQLTHHGLCELHSTVKERELCLFFRNNHFSTLFKFGGLLYLLMTDEGYLRSPVVWERLEQVEGDNEFVTAEFHIFRASNVAPMLLLENNNNDQTSRQHSIYPPPPNNHMDADYLLALELQQREDDAALRASSNQQQPPHLPPPPQRPTPPPPPQHVSPPQDTNSNSNLNPPAINRARQQQRQQQSQFQQQMGQYRQQQTAQHQTRQSHVPESQQPLTYAPQQQQQQVQQFGRGDGREVMDRHERVKKGKKDSSCLVQ